MIDGKREQYYETIVQILTSQVFFDTAFLIKRQYMCAMVLAFVNGSNMNIGAHCSYP